MKNRTLLLLLLYPFLLSFAQLPPPSQPTEVSEPTPEITTRFLPPSFYVWEKGRYISTQSPKGNSLIFQDRLQKKEITHLTSDFFKDWDFLYCACAFTKTPKGEPQFFVSATDGEKVRLLLWHKGKWEKRWEIHTKGEVHGLAFNPDCSLLLIAMISYFSEGELRIVSPSNGDTLHQIFLPEEVFPSAQVTFSPDGKQIALLTSDLAQLLLCDLKGRSKALPLSAPAHSLCFSPKGDRIAIGKRDGTIEIVNAEDFSFLSSLQIEKPSQEELESVFPPPPPQMLPSMMMQREMRQRILSQSISSLDFSPDGSLLLATTPLGWCGVYDWQGRRLLQTYKPKKYQVGTAIARFLSSDRIGIMRTKDSLWGPLEEFPLKRRS